VIRYDPQTAANSSNQQQHPTETVFPFVSIVSRLSFLKSPAAPKQLQGGGHSFRLLVFMQGPLEKKKIPDLILTDKHCCTQCNPESLAEYSLQVCENEALLSGKLGTGCK
jgi:hypothetical protein